MTQVLLAGMVIAAAALHAGGAVAQNYPNRPKATRARQYPDFPAIAETLPGYESGGWFGFYRPRRHTARDHPLLKREMNHAMPLRDVREKLTAFGLEIHTEPPEYFTEVIRRDFDKWGKLVREIGLRPP